MDEVAHSRLTGKVAIITGAAQGIGEATARLFAARGIKGLMLTDRQEGKLKAVADSLGAKYFVADLSDPTQVDRIVPAADAAFGRVDILVNVAGLTDRGTVWNTDVALWDRMFAINVRAPFFLMQAAARVMKRERSGGAMVNIASINVHGGASFLTPYSASKAALAVLTKNVAHSLLPERIRVNALNPGWVDTPGEDTTLRKFHDAQDDWREVGGATRPFGRLISAEEVARAIAFLASDESGLMTGTAIDYDQLVMGVNETIGPRTPD
jgi:NAD(P)-dependent dehydrogenase (short-subunit alcohol dehydrogenase family)